jgi:hypothetical protein
VRKLDYRCREESEIYFRERFDSHIAAILCNADVAKNRLAKGAEQSGAFFASPS